LLSIVTLLVPFLVTPLMATETPGGPVGHPPPWIVETEQLQAHVCATCPRGKSPDGTRRAQSFVFVADLQLQSSPELNEDGISRLDNSPADVAVAH